jgi:hypothetical protein
VFIIKDRGRQPPRRIQQSDAGPMRRHRNRIDPVIAVELRQPVQDERPMPVGIEMRPRRAGLHLIGPGDHGDFGQRFQIDQRQLGVRLADVDDGDVVRPTHAKRPVMACGTGVAGSW